MANKKAGVIVLMAAMAATLVYSEAGFRLQTGGVQDFELMADKNAGTAENAASQEGNAAAASEYQDMTQKGDKGFFLESGFLYRYSHFNPAPLIKNNSANGLFGLEYDFGKVELALNFDIGLAHATK
jgi:hypothetical protein